MEAARTLTGLPERVRTQRFARECEALRPLGEAYLLRRFGGSLDRADAEDAVAEVIIRLHRQAQAGRPPRNLRAAFFTAVKNAAIDQLRSRAAKPTVALEVVAEAPAAESTPAEQAEGREQAVRLREALGRMRGNYREAIVLRFGLGLTVPEIARHLQISLPAAKKLVLRATRQVRERLQAIEADEFCPQMREHARRSIFEKEASGLASDAERLVLRSHFEHCGPCRSFLASLNQNLHELGGGALLVGGAGRTPAIEHVGRWLGDAGHGLQAAAAKARLAAYKLSGALSTDGGAPAGAITTTGQKIAAVCTAGAATTATCLATGIVGPGIGATTPPPAVEKTPPAKVKTVAETPPAAEEAPPPLVPPEPSPTASNAPSPEATAPASSPPEPTPAQQSQAEFGIEPELEPAPIPEPAPPPAPSGATSSSAPPSGGGGGESFGFGG
jgi:RNA polymerase sigma factor (sigma-70 family)